MSILQTLRNTPWLAKLALLWFALALGAAVASPMVNPQQELMICSAAGMYKVTVNSDGSLSGTLVSEAHCPLCAVAGAPPGFLSFPSVSTQALTDVRRVPVPDPVAACTAAPPPSRAPPTLL